MMVNKKGHGVTTVCTARVILSFPSLSLPVVTEDVYANLMKAHSCYSIIPSSTKIVVFDTRLRVSFSLSLSHTHTHSHTLTHTPFSLMSSLVVV